MSDAGPPLLRFFRIAGPSRSVSGACAALLSGTLLGCCFPPVDVTWLAWAAIAPLGIALSARRLTAEISAGVYLGGLAYHLIALQWINAQEPHIAFLALWLFVCQIGAIVFCVTFLAARWVVVRFRFPGCIGLPLFWLGFEFLRVLVVGAIDPAATPWLRLGGTQAEWLLVAQVAAFGGETAIGLLVALVNGWLFDLARWGIAQWRGESVRWHAASLITPIAIGVAFWWGWLCLGHDGPTTGPTVALLGRHEWLVDPDRRFDNVSRGDDANRARPDVLIWPELSDHHKYVTGPMDVIAKVPADVQSLSNVVSGDYSAWYHDRLSQAARLADAAILVGCERVDLSGDLPQRYNCVAYASASDGFIGCSDKKYLAPLFERPMNAMAWLGLPALCNYSPGDAAPLFAVETASGQYDFACILCYDIAYSHRIATLGHSGATDFFVHCGSEASDPTGVLSTTLLRMARLRAIESRRPIVRNCHGGASGIIDQTGRFTPCELGADGLSCVTVPLVASDTTRQHSGANALALTALTLVAVCLSDSFRWLRRTQLFAKQVPRLRAEQGFTTKVANTRSAGFTLMELLAVVVIMGTLVAMIIPRVVTTGDTAKQRVDERNRSLINAAVERYYLMEGVWPANNLSDIAADADYFPDGIPTNPVTGAAYTLNASTHRVHTGGGGGGGGK